MGVLVFRHVPFEGLGLIGDVLDARGVPYDYIDLARDPGAAPDAGSAAALIFMGGPMSANDGLPYLRTEMDILGRAIAAGRPILGVCLGAQLIAKTLGAPVYRNPVKEIGWSPVRWTAAARHDLLFAGLTEPETVFHWHGETFDLPPGAEWLAWSDACRHQAFRAGPGVYGIQFHIEVTADMIAGWLAEEANGPDVRELATLPDPQANTARMAELSRLVFGRWLDLVAV